MSTFHYMYNNNVFNTPENPVHVSLLYLYHYTLSSDKYKLEIKGWNMTGTSQLYVAAIFKLSSLLAQVCMLFMIRFIDLHDWDLTVMLSICLFHPNIFLNCTVKFFSVSKCWIKCIAKWILLDFMSMIFFF